MKRVQFARTLAGLGLTLGAAACSDNDPEITQLTAGVVQITFNGCGVEPTVEFAGSTT